MYTSSINMIASQMLTNPLTVNCYLIPQTKKKENLLVLKRLTTAK